MPIESSTDPRDRLVREKYFSMRPRPLERWLWEQRLSQAAERVFWLHWDAGQRNGTWCSEISLREVAEACRVDISTVTRAYHSLKSLDLVSRQDPGRDPSNPFQQATAITEVRLPHALLAELGRHPTRASGRAGGSQIVPVGGEGNGAARPPKMDPEAAFAVTEAPTCTPSRQEIHAMWSRASEAERGRHFTASREGRAQIAFDSDTRLTVEDRQQLLKQLEQMALARTQPQKATKSVPTGFPAAQAKSRRLTPLELARTRKRVLELVPGAQAAELLRQVVWAAEEGALRRFEMPLAVNIALKKIREGLWSRPNRMPPNWSRLAASPETCSAA